MRARLTRGLVLALVFGLAGPAVAGKPAKKAATKPAAVRKSAPAPSHGAPKERTPSPASAGTSSSDSEPSGASDDAPSPAAPSQPASGGKVKSKAYSFGAMDVEGKLKTPQLLYFLNRVKMELDMSAPDKRSFMKELQQSADDKNL